MFDWIAGLIGRYSRTIAGDIRDMVGVVVHGLAGVVYTVFGNVGLAWTNVHAEIDNLWGWGAQFVDNAYWVVYRVIHVDVPVLWNYALSGFRQAEATVEHFYSLAVSGARTLFDDAVGQIQAVIRWAITNIFDPLKAYADQIYNDLLKWGYTAYQYITHPALLAALLLGPLIGAAEAAFFTIAGPVGRFILGILLHQAQRFAQLLEDIVTGVL